MSGWRLRRCSGEPATRPRLRGCSQIEYKMHSRDNLLEFIADLSGPIGPEVFAGFRSKLQHEMTDDLSALDRAMDEWSCKVDTKQALNSLFDIACNPPGVEFHNNFIGRFRESWDLVITDLLYRPGKRDRNGLLAWMSLLKDKDSAKNILNELGVWISEEDE